MSLIYLSINIESIPWIGLVLALLWSTYNLIRKKINVEADIGLFIESLFLTPIALLLFYFISQKGLNDFNLSTAY